MLLPRAWRDELGFSQERMAALVGVTRICWQRYEAGERVPRLDVMVRCQELSAGRVSAASWLALSLSLPQLGPRRLYGSRPQGATADAARA